jgi:hypothetical protein
LSQKVLGGAVLSRAESAAACSSKSSQERAQEVRRRVPKRFMATGNFPEEGCSKSRTGPPCLAARSAMAAMSSFRSTRSRTRTSSPDRSTRSRNSLSEE